MRGPSLQLVVPSVDPGCFEEAGCAGQEEATDSKFLPCVNCSDCHDDDDEL